MAFRFLGNVNFGGKTTRAREVGSDNDRYVCC